MALRTFPSLVGVSYPVKKSPVWLTDFQRSFSGKVTTLGRYSFPYYNIELTYEFLRSDITTREYQTLVAFFNLANGRANAWLFNDPDDNAVTEQQFGTGDGATTSFQLFRSIVGQGGLTWLDPVYAPLTQTIYANGVLVDPGDYTVGPTGAIVFNAAPLIGVQLTWTGTFAWVCRFSEDSSTFEQFMKNFWLNGKVSFDSEKL